MTRTETGQVTAPNSADSPAIQQAPTPNSFAIREALEADSTAFFRLDNPKATASTTTAATKGFRMPIFVASLTIDPVPTDAAGTELPYVVLFDVQRHVDVATWTNVRTNNNQKLPTNTDISPCWLIATRNQADWEAERKLIINGGGNGEPGTATNGSGHA